MIPRKMLLKVGIFYQFTGENLLTNLTFIGTKMEHTLDALVVEDDLVVVRFGNIFGDGVFSATSSAGTRGVPGGVRSLRNTAQSTLS
jgi:hypothetical protein